MVIRYANLSDVPLVVELAKVEHGISQWKTEPFHDRLAEQLAISFIEMHGRTLLLSERGYLAGMVQPMGFSGKYQAIEYAWFAADGRGMELLASFEDWAKRMGAREIIVHDYANNGHLTQILARRRGYAELGMAMRKVFQ